VGQRLAVGIERGHAAPTNAEIKVEITVVRWFRDEEQKTAERTEKKFSDLK